MVTLSEIFNRSATEVLAMASVNTKPGLKVKNSESTPKSQKTTKVGKNMRCFISNDIEIVQHNASNEVIFFPVFHNRLFGGDSTLLCFSSLHSTLKLLAHEKSIFEKMFHEAM